MSSALQRLFSTHERSWLDFCSSDSEISTLLENKLSPLLSDSSLESVKQGIDLLCNFDELSLVSILSLVDSSIEVSSSYRANTSLIERCLLEYVSLSTSIWHELCVLGGFDGMLLRNVEGVGESALSEAIRCHLLDLSKRMVLVPPGTFMMGGLSDDEKAASSEKPRHQVKISHAFWMCKYQVTQVLWESVMGANPSKQKGVSYPVDEIRWAEAILFCNLLSEKEGLEKVYELPTGFMFGMDDDICDDLCQQVKVKWSSNGYRLPTESEWEYAARGGEEHIYAGSNDLGEVGWYSENSDNRIHGVGLKRANGFGLYDMSGNVWEWCWDIYKRKYSHRVVTDPRGPSHGSRFRMHRGGAWVAIASCSRLSYRNHLKASYPGKTVGFRVLRAAQSHDHL